MPSIFDDFDDFFRGPARGHGRDPQPPMPTMQTDIKETKEGYEVTMNLPGIQKEDVQVELSDGTLTISAKASSSSEESDKGKRFIRRERFSGSCSRSFYVGKDLRQEDIKAKMQDGTLMLFIPKKDTVVEETKSNFISIDD